MSRDVCGADKMSAVQFKVGDRVRLVNTIYGSKNEKVGDEFTVLFVSDGGALYVHTDGVRPLSGGGWSKGVRDGWLPCRFEKIKPKRDYVADHARRTLRKAGLSAEEARRAVANWNGTTHPLSSLSRKLPAPLSMVLLGAFTWSESPEGVRYWVEIHSREFKKQEEHAQAQ